MKKKALGIILCTAMAAVTLSACGGSSESAAPAETQAAAEAPADAAAEAPAEAETEAPAEAAASEDGLITVGFAQVGHESDWRTASTASCQNVFTKENGFDLQFVDCDQDSAVQIEAVRGFIEQGVDYIIIDPIVSTGWDTVLGECEDAGIPVIVIDRTIDDSDKYAAWVGSNFLTEGLEAGEWLKVYAEAKGVSEINALVIEGTTGASAQIGRTDGFKEIADREGWNIIDSQSGDFTQAGGQEVMESYIKSYEGQFNVVVCQNDNEAFGAMDAMDAAGISYGVGGDVILISFDACTAGLEFVKAGKINADFECNPLAAPFVKDVIEQLEDGQTPEQTLYMVEHIFANEDIIPTITVDGQELEITVVDDAVIEAQY